MQCLHIYICGHFNTFIDDFNINIVKPIIVIIAIFLLYNNHASRYQYHPSKCFFPALPQVLPLYIPCKLLWMLTSSVISLLATSRSVCDCVHLNSLCSYWSVHCDHIVSYRPRYIIILNPNFGLIVAASKFICAFRYWLNILFASSHLCSCGSPLDIHILATMLLTIHTLLQLK